MKNIEMRELSNKGHSYIRDHLAATNVFCKALLETVDRIPGDIITFAPVGSPIDRLEQFETGGLLPVNSSNAVHLHDGSMLVPVESLKKEQVKLLRETMSSENQAVCIIGDYNSRWSDQSSFLGKTAFEVVNEMYHLLTKDHSDEEYCGAISLGDTIWHGVTAICKSAPCLDHMRTSTALSLEQCAATAVLITCTAYDGEGFVAWRRKSATDCELTRTKQR